MTMAPPRAIEWVGGEGGHLRLLDQTRLPGEVVYRDCTQLEEVRTAIRELAVRGAPAIGVSAAYGLVLWLQGNLERAHAEIDTAIERLASSRPTAVNLAWALERMRRRWEGGPPQPPSPTRGEGGAGGLLPAGDVSSTSEAPAPPLSPRGRGGAGGGEGALALMLAEAHAIAAEDRAMCEAMGRHGAELIRDGSGVLTHCNTGALATAGLGTALAALYVAWGQGKRFRVFADETRPLLQGARLTAWELVQAGIDTTLICDGMAAQVMREGRVQMVIVGADRIAANGDTANKIGTYGVAVLAKAHGVPFYVAAPSSTFDLSLPDGQGIPIEQRDAREITQGMGKQTAPDGVQVYNPAFDVTPAELITGIITEKGVIGPVSVASIRATLGGVGSASGEPGA